MECCSNYPSVPACPTVHLHTHTHTHTHTHSHTHTCTYTYTHTHIHTCTYTHTHTHTHTLTHAHTHSLTHTHRSLPNWMKLRQGGKGWGDEEGKISVYTRESETLCNNLGSEPLRRGSVVLNAENLRLLAILHESMVRGGAWLGTEINVSATHNSPLWNLH